MSLKEFIPPVLLRYIIGMFYGWKGNYSSWDEAKKKCTGYNTDVIFNKVKNSLFKVKTGEAAYERDSVLFDKIQYSYPLLSALLYVTLKNKNCLNVLDFGGSLGSSYYQNKYFFKDIKELNWCVVEQSHFVTEGKRNFADGYLDFFYDIETCLEKHSINVVLLSSVLQYLEEPYVFIEKIISKKIEYIIIDRTPVLIKGEDRITIQKVPGKIYKAKYPSRILNEKKLSAYFLKDYEVIFEDYSAETINLENAFFKTLFLKRKSN